MTCPWLDFKLFGSGRGMSMPFWNGIFYWLNNEADESWYTTTDHRRNYGKIGDLYTFMHGFGAQLHSYQWTHPNAGERRVLAGKTFAPFHSTRKLGRVEVAWGMTDLPRDTDAANKAIRDFEAELNKRSR
jgi:hypothetical protein